MFDVRHYFADFLHHGFRKGSPADILFLEDGVRPYQGTIQSIVNSADNLVAKGVVVKLYVHSQIMVVFL